MNFTTAGDRYCLTGLCPNCYSESKHAELLEALQTESVAGQTAIAIATDEHGKNYVVSANTLQPAQPKSPKQTCPYCGIGLESNMIAAENAGNFNRLLYCKNCGHQLGIASCSSMDKLSTDRSYSLDSRLKYLFLQGKIKVG
jgi:hypothetical protein